MFYTWLEHTPIGRIFLAGHQDKLKYLVFDHEKSIRRHALPKDGWEENDRPFADTIRQLTAYFAGKLTQFDLPADGDGTPFQQSVWQALRDVPYGQTCSYGDIAQAIGKPKASRAVGMANGRNPISIIVPCHRIIGGNGSLVGYGGGLERKSTLLKLEGVL